jgi:AAA ATPase domain
VAPAVSEPALQIIGREPELDVLTAAVDAAAEAGRTLAVCGEPGIGKSVLIGAAARRGQERGYLVLRATGVEAESRLPFAGLHELLCPLLEAADALAPPQRRALLSAFGVEDGGSPELFLICLAALNVPVQTPAASNSSISTGVTTPKPPPPPRIAQNSDGP